MGKIDNIYESIKLNNNDLQDNVHFFFNLLLMSDFEQITESRFTTVFIIKMLYAFINGAHIDSIVNEIEELEKPSLKYRRMKSETQFTKLPLVGLWHKHYEQIGISSMAINIKHQINSSKTFFKDFFEIYNNLEITENEKVRQLGYLSSGQQYLDRIENGKLTGEWIIYHTYEGKNYYLSVGKHTDGDDVLAREIRDIALFEFPFFKDSLPIFE